MTAPPSSSTIVLVRGDVVRVRRTRNSPWLELCKRLQTWHLSAARRRLTIAVSFVIAWMSYSLLKDWTYFWGFLINRLQICIFRMIGVSALMYCRWESVSKPSRITHLYWASSVRKRLQLFQPSRKSTILRFPICGRLLNYNWKYVCLYLSIFSTIPL